MSIDPFTIVLRPGTQTDHKGRSFSVFVKVEWTGKRLSISGVEGPRTNGDALGACGQINPVRVVNLVDGWTQQQVDTLNTIWERWHLNDMRAGSPDQMEWLRANPIVPSDYAYPKSHYEVAKDRLREAGLEPDALQYSYGSAWLHEDVPDDVVLALRWRCPARPSSPLGYDLPARALTNRLPSGDYHANPPSNRHPLPRPLGHSCSTYQRPLSRQAYLCKL